MKSGHLSRYEGHLRNLLRACKGNIDAYGVEAGDQVSFSSCQSDIGIPINFQEESGIVTFESSELGPPLNMSRDVRHPVQMRRGTRVFSSVSTGDSDISSSCEMKDEPT